MTSLLEPTTKNELALLADCPSVLMAKDKLEHLFGVQQNLRSEVNFYSIRVIASAVFVPRRLVLVPVRGISIVLEMREQILVMADCSILNINDTIYG